MDEHNKTLRSWFNKHSSTVLTTGLLLSPILIFFAVTYIPRFFNTPLDWVRKYQPECQKAMLVKNIDAIDTQEKCDSLEKNFLAAKEKIPPTLLFTSSFTLAFYKYKNGDSTNAIKYCESAIPAGERELSYTVDVISKNDIELRMNVCKKILASK